MKSFGGKSFTKKVAEAYGESLPITNPLFLNITGLYIPSQRCTMERRHWPRATASFNSLAFSEHATQTQAALRLPFAEEGFGTSSEIVTNFLPGLWNRYLVLKKHFFAPMNGEYTSIIHHILSADACFITQEVLRDYEQVALCISPILYNSAIIFLSEKLMKANIPDSEKTTAFRFIHERGAAILVVYLCDVMEVPGLVAGIHTDSDPSTRRLTRTMVNLVYSFIYKDIVLHNGKHLSAAYSDTHILDYEEGGELEPVFVKSHPIGMKRDDPMLSTLVEDDEEDASLYHIIPTDNEDCTISETPDWVYCPDYSLPGEDILCTVF